MKHYHPFLADLARFVPVFTREQLSKHYFCVDQKKMLRLLKRYEKLELIQTSTAFVRERVNTASPIFTFKSGQVDVSPDKIAYVASRRWSEITSPQLVVLGTVKLAALYGGKVHRVTTASISHECYLTDVFLSKRLANPEFEWALTDVRPGNGSLPDALTATAAIEIVGRYNGKTVAGKLAIAATTDLELW